MALRMSQMLRSSEDVRSTRPTAKKKDVLPAQKKVREEPVPEELSAAAAPPKESTIISILRACMGKLREGEALLVETMRQHQGVPDLAERGANSAILSMRLQWS